MMKTYCIKNNDFANAEKKTACKFSRVIGKMLAALVFIWLVHQ